MQPKPERCTALVRPAGWSKHDAYRCKLSATHVRDGHAVCHCHVATSKPVRYVAEATAATGRRALERTP
jgi:hypothetical protein